jgi:hypothetical protein
MKESGKIWKNIRLMKPSSFRIFAAFVLVLFPRLVQAGLLVSDNAGNYSSWGSTASSASTSASASTIGIASPGWQFANTAGGNGSDNGSFLGGSQQVGQSLNINSSSGNAWGLYGNSGQQSIGTATFNNSLSVGQILTVDMQNNFIQAGGTVGVNLKSTTGATLFTFQFTGGGSDYNYVNQTSSGSSSGNTTLGFYENGLQIQATEGVSDSLTIVVTEQSSQGNFSGSSWSETFASTADIGQIQFFDNNAGSGGPNNAYFNNLQVVPEPIGKALMFFAGLTGLLLCWQHRGSMLRVLISRI